jgi:hypothetical protein
VSEEDNGATDELMLSLEVSMSSGDSFEGPSGEGRPSKVVVSVGVSGISGSWGGLLIGLPFTPLTGEGAGIEAGDADQRRWSRRQYEKTVDGGMAIYLPSQRQVGSQGLTNGVIVHCSYQLHVLG